MLKEKKNKLINNTKLFNFLKTKLGKKIIAYFLKKGQYTKAKKIISLMFFYITKRKKKIKINSIILFKIALLNVISFFEAKTMKRGGSLLVISLPIYQKKRRLFLIFQFLINFLKKLSKKKKINLSKKLASEFLLLYQKKGSLYKKFQNHKEYSISQQPYLHYRWE